MPRPSRATVALDLMRLTEALADALESGDLDAAQGLLATREEVLQTAPGTAPADSRTLAEAAAAVAEATRRGEAALLRAIAEARAELASLGRGAEALRAYFPAEPPAPGWVDRHE